MTSGALEKIVAQLFHLGAGQFGADVFGAGGVGGDEGEIDFVSLGAGEGDLGLFRLFLDALEGVGLFAEVHAVLAFELVENPVHDPVVPVVAAQMGVAIGGFDLENAVADFQDRDVEGAAAQVINRDFLVFLLVESVGQRGRGRLVNNAQDLQAGDASGVLGGLALGIVEIGGDGDDRLGDLFAQAHFGVGLELGEDHGRNFRRAELLGFAVHLDFHGDVAVGAGDHFVRDALEFLLHFAEFTAHEAFDGIDRVAGVGDGLPLGGVADQAFAGLGEGDHGRCGAFAFRVFQNHRFAAFHDGHARVGGSEINADNLRHNNSVSCFLSKLDAISFYN